MSDPYLAGVVWRLLNTPDADANTIDPPHERPTTWWRRLLRRITCS